MPDKVLRRSLIALLVLLGGCAGRMGDPAFSSIKATPVRAELARLYFYRAFEPYESLAWPLIYLNGAPLAPSQPGVASFRDIEPGSYAISVFSPGLYPNQFKKVLLHPGETIYVRIESLRNWYRGFNWERDTFVVSLVGATEAQADMAALRYVE